MRALWTLCAALAFGALFCASVATAQEADKQPIVEMELSATEVIPGQPVVLRITVLVPTWLPKPVVFPSLEVPNVMVKLMERATTPTSKTISGESWSGVIRAYRLSPMVPGPVQIPPQQIQVTWAEPGKTDPLVATLSLDPITLTGSLPPGTEDLDPFLAANSVTLTEDISTENRDFVPGDSLTRKVTLDVQGTSPIFAPTLLPPHRIDGLASYPAEPIVMETADRTWLSGQRVEATTLVAEGGGAGLVPPVEVRWYNLETEEIETARLEGFEIRVDGPVVRQGNRLDLWRIVLLAVSVLLGLVVLAAVGRRIWPKVAAWQATRKAAHRASERWAYDRLRKAVAAQNYSATLNAYDLWITRVPPVPRAFLQEIDAAFARLGAVRFGPESHPAPGVWDDLSSRLEKARAAALRHHDAQSKHAALVALNPGSATS